MVYRKYDYSLSLFRNILSYETEVQLFPFLLNVTNRQYDVVLVDSRGVGLSIRMVDFRLVGRITSLVISIKKILRKYMASLLHLLQTHRWHRLNKMLHILRSLGLVPILTRIILRI